jgi:hypothetical protein
MWCWRPSGFATWGWNNIRLHPPRLHRPGAPFYQQKTLLIAPNRADFMFFMFCGFFGNPTIPRDGCPDGIVA